MSLDSTGVGELLIDAEDSTPEDSSFTEDTIGVPLLEELAGLLYADGLLTTGDAITVGSPGKLVDS